MMPLTKYGRTFGVLAGRHTAIEVWTFDVILLIYSNISPDACMLLTLNGCKYDEHKQRKEHRSQKPILNMDVSARTHAQSVCCYFYPVLRQINVICRNIYYRKSAQKVKSLQSILCVSACALCAFPKPSSPIRCIAHHLQQSLPLFLSMARSARLFSGFFNLCIA